MADDTFLADMTRKLWPDAGDRRRALVLPQPARPRLLVDVTDRRAAARIVRGLTAGRSATAIARREIIAGALHLGAGPLAARRSGLPIHDGGLTGFLREVLGRPVRLGMAVGPPRSNRKPVVAAVTPDGRPVAFAKIGVNDLTRALVAAEARALSALADAPGDWGVVTPRLLYSGTYAGHPVVVQSALGTGRATVLRPDELVAATSAVIGLEPDRLPLSKTEQWGTLRGRLAALTTPTGTRLRDAADDLERTSGDVETPVGAWHGDWSPWNVASAGGTVLAWDWERFGTGAPAGFDALHYRVQEHLAAGAAMAAAVSLVTGNAAEILTPYGQPLEHSRAIMGAYLLEVGTRYAEDRQDSAGSRVGELDTWLMPALGVALTRP